MTPEYVTISLAVDLALVVTAIALVARSRWRLCWGFALYITKVVAFNLCIVLWPERFLTTWFWIAGYGVLQALKFWIGLEVAGHVLRSISGASATARNAAVLALGVIVLTTVGPHVYDARSGVIPSAWLPWTLNGPLFIMLATLAIAWWHRVPLHPFQGALLTSFSAYLAVFDLMGQLARSWYREWPLQRFEREAFLVLACWWAYIAWRRDPLPMPPQPGAMPLAARDRERPPEPPRSGLELVTAP